MDTQTVKKTALALLASAVVGGGALIFVLQNEWLQPEPPPIVKTSSQHKISAQFAPPLAEYKSNGGSKADVPTLEKELDDLKFAIDQGDYVRKINDPLTPDYIKTELRAQIRLFARKSLELVKEQNL